MNVVYFVFEAVHLRYVLKAFRAAVAAVWLSELVVSSMAISSVPLSVRIHCTVTPNRYPLMYHRHTRQSSLINLYFV